ncbi:hemolysin III family protein [Aeromicrobium sp. 636]|uniref:Hemolysin III family protein n=1 Tax=Aeromicrobium senzhongii TaxID=2663859 RepID=A0A8I0ET29_9ACTN|nr:MULTISPECIES: hemolysin III family protein [Aeromicrobium]MBC9225931.1 hemolysin III family protein [Aeromicrobium senzhongii]MCQ3998038.1 hemolysin III family protein [Aeromicrobium sp. 636]MTB87954.1 hemolysin III family protein [Aeromicrobium senzhongii]QNL95032.1 hemolysin III family protein [Aeromicrobium senzhongii]
MPSPKPDTTVDEVGDRIRDTVEEMKPRLRGWLHAATAPLALISFLIMLVFADSLAARAGAAVFMLSALLLFGVSAVYHTVPWRERAKQVLRRLDHSNIFIMIAGSYTPFSLLLLNERQTITLLSLVWGGAILGVLFKVFWLSAPRWVYVPLYLALGWAALIYLPDFMAAASTTVFAMLVLGGIFYTVGALVYAFQWPDPNPRWFGYHEVFHALTIAAFIVHYIGVSFLVYQS